MSRYSRSRNKTQADDYIHLYRCFGITSVTLKNGNNMTDYIEGCDFIPNELMYAASVGRRRGKKKSAPELRALIRSKCKQRKRNFKKNIAAFEIATEEATPEQISQFLGRASPAPFRPSADDLRGWEDDGFHIAAIIGLIHEQRPDLKNTLEFNNGQWSGALCVYDKIFKGDVVFGDGNMGRRDNMYGQNDDNNDDNNDDAPADNRQIVRDIYGRGGGYARG
eukprot:915775_1